MCDSAICSGIASTRVCLSASASAWTNCRAKSAGCTLVGGHQRFCIPAPVAGSASLSVPALKANYLGGRSRTGSVLRCGWNGGATPLLLPLAQGTPIPRQSRPCPATVLWKCPDSPAAHRPLGYAQCQQGLVSHGAQFLQTVNAARWWGLPGTRPWLSSQRLPGSPGLLSRAPRAQRRNCHDSAYLVKILLCNRCQIE